MASMSSTPQGPFQATWESLKKYQTPEWYLDAKFGIFIHWGVYSVPAFGNEWYPRQMYLKDTPEYRHHTETFGQHTEFGYKDFIPQFRAENYHPEEWSSLFQEAGARYIVPVAEHHDGFAMYESALTDWSAAKMGPKRDLIGELAQAVREKGIIFGVSSHRAEHWWFMNGGRQFPSDVQEVGNQAFYGPATTIETQQWESKDWQPRPDAAYLEDWLARSCELVDRYQPQVFWFDWWIEQTVFKPYLQRFATYYYNRAAEWQKGVAINYKNDAFPVEAAVFDIERGQMKNGSPYFWQTDTSISKNSWGYVTAQEYKTPTSLLQDLIDIVSKNGALLLNVGPRPDGTIPEPEQEILREMGRWLKVNGEAIYGTRPWKICGEGPTEIPEGSFTDTKRPDYTGQDIRFTRRGNTLYAIALNSPDSPLVIHSLANQSPEQVTLLGYDGALRWHSSADGLVVEFPDQPVGKHAYAMRIEGLAD